MPHSILPPSVRVGLVLALAAALAPSARSNTVSASPASSAASSSLGSAQLQALVPERVGAWKRHALTGPVPGSTAENGVFAQAEFRRGKDRATMKVQSLGAGAAPPADAPPKEQTTVEGTERSYSEAGHAIRESLRAADGRVDLSLHRPDGVIVTVRSHGVAASDLKALALAVKRTR